MNEGTTERTCLEMIRYPRAEQTQSKMCDDNVYGAAWAIKYGPNCDLCGPCAIWVNIETFHREREMEREGGTKGGRTGQGRALTHQSQKIKDCAADWS